MNLSGSETCISVNTVINLFGWLEFVLTPRSHDAPAHDLPSTRETGVLVYSSDPSSPHLSQKLQNKIRTRRNLSTRHQASSINKHGTPQAVSHSFLVDVLSFHEIGWRYLSRSRNCLWSFCPESWACGMSRCNVWTIVLRSTVVDVIQAQSQQQRNNNNNNNTRSHHWFFLAHSLARCLLLVHGYKETNSTRARWRFQKLVLRKDRPGATLLGSMTMTPVGKCC